MPSLRTAASAWRITAGLLALSVSLAACFSKKPAQPPPPPASFTLHVQGTSDINPDAEGRPSPVWLRIYELRGDAAFQSADFLGLFDHDKQVLAGDLIAQDRYSVNPGQSMDIVMKADPDTRVVAVLAEFRDYRNSQSRASLVWNAPPDPGQPVKKAPRPSTSLRVLLNGKSVAISADVPPQH